MKIEDKLKDHILDSIGEGVFTVDKDFRVNFFNKSAERITGLKSEEVIGNICKTVFRSESCFANCPISLVLRTRENIYDFKSDIQCAGGSNVPIKLSASVLYNEDNIPTGGIVTFRELNLYEKIGITLEEEEQFQGMIGHSKQMKEIFRLIEEIAGTDAPVLILGESGTGKELVANAIQKISPRNQFPFVKINCSVFPANLLSSELFGHVKGAFTDAIKDRPGRFEIADKGTIFLDEVAEMPLQMQVQLLRVLQEGTFERVGESVVRRTNVRVIAATNIDIQNALKKGLFREDLYYRLNVIPISIPPLRDRKEDIVPLVRHFLRKFSVYYKKQISEIESSTVELLLSYSWPGNIRELENVIEFAFVRTNGSSPLSAEKLPPALQNKYPEFVNRNKPAEIVSESRERFEILSLLEKNKWNRQKTAEDLNIDRTTLWRKMKRLNLTD